MMKLLFNKKVIIGIIVLVLLIFVAGKLSATKRVGKPYIPNPDGKNSFPAGWSPDTLARKLFDAMDGVNFSVTDEELAWNELLNLPNNAMIKAVYARYNQLFFHENEETLTQTIQGETGSVIGSNKKAVLEKLRSLGLH